MNGSTVNQGRQDAQAWTEELDRVTNPEFKDTWRGGSDNGLNRGQAGGIGSKVLTYNSEGGMGSGHVEQTAFVDRGGQQPEYFDRSRQQAENAEIVREIAGVDNGYSLEVAANPNKVGEETKLQVQERISEDREDIENEQGLNGRYVKNLMDHNNKKLTKEVVAWVDKTINRVYHPAELDLAMNKSRTNFLKDVFNRILGSRNG